MRVGVTWQIAGVQRDPAPGDALHVRHLCPFINARGMMNFLFQDCENPCGSWVPRSPRADTRPRDADTVTIYVCHLLGSAGHDQQRSLGRTLRLQTYSPVFSVTVSGETRAPSVKVSADR